eukprot:scaffold59246_cov62-Attheya_sp.AAC.3
MFPNTTGVHNRQSLSNFGWWDSNPDRETESCYALILTATAGGLPTLTIVEASREATVHVCFTVGQSYEQYTNYFTCRVVPVRHNINGI